MIGRVAELQDAYPVDNLASAISNLYHEWNTNRAEWLKQKRELRDYIFATDTTTTSNSELPWKNKTTLPKLCQIRDNIHANYMAALFPNEDWLKWEAYSNEASDKDKRAAIEAYMSNKVRQSGFMEVVSKLLYDYIDYGNCFASVEFVKETYDDPQAQEDIIKYVGPKATRRSPVDIVFNPVANTFEEAPKVFRYLKTIGDLKVEAEETEDNAHLLKAIKEIEEKRAVLADYDSSDIDKAFGFTVDGFGSLAEYYQSEFVEIFEFYGDINHGGGFERNRVITILDRTAVLRNEPNKSWLGRSPFVHGAWRYRPDNLYGMGPLDNLVGMQYRIDHLENIKADLFDLIAHPPLKIKGNVEEFDWEPFAQIYLGDDGEVDVLKVDATALQADTQIQILEQRMEEYAGAPREAMGIRSPGEKTAFEVQSLQNAASRIFQEKITQFEVNVIEPLLNAMLEMGRRNLDGVDVIKVMDTDLGVESFVDITRDDIKAKGKIRPIGARHFAARAQLVQNYMGFRNVFAQDPGVMNHVSGKAEARLFEDALGLERFNLVQENVRITEQTESARLSQTGEGTLAQEQLTQQQGDFPFGG